MNEHLSAVLRTAGRTAGLLILAAIAAAAQEPVQPAPDETAAAPAFEPQPPPPSDAPPWMVPPKPHVERWLEHIREKDPEEFDRMKKLRASNPAEFRRALHRRLLRQRVADTLREAPRLKEFLAGLPETDREELVSRLERLGAPPGQGFAPEHPDPEVHRLEQETADLARRYRDAPDEGEKERLRDELRTKLEIAFDRRENARREHVKKIETDLDHLKKTIATRQAKRPEIIERRLQELTGEDLTRW
jgi:hypothetical protein